MRQLILALFLAAQAFSQFPQLSTSGPNRPTMQVGSQLSNIGTSTVYTQAGAPTVPSCPSGSALCTSVVGDVDIDTTNKIFYVCMAGNTPCTTWQISGPPSVVPVTVFGVNGNSSTDPTNFQIAIDSMAGHGCLYIPAGTTVNLSAAASTTGILANSCIKGDGATSIISGSSSLPSLSPVLATSFSTGNIELSGFQINGGCTSTPTGVAYSTATSGLGAAQAMFVTGTSIQITGGPNSSGINIHDITINHTCGYAIEGDTTTGNISNLTIRRVNIINSRQYTFGTGSDLTYGSWTGGIILYGPGTTYSYSNVVIDGCNLQNVVGNGIWFHQGVNTVKSTNVQITNNTGLDLGLDFTQPVDIAGLVETGNKVNRFGYVITSDVGATRVGGPKWLQNYVPVAYDMGGVVSQFTISNNEATGNGEGIDLDGAEYGVVSGNSLTSCFASPDPLASNGSCGPYGSGTGPITPGANNYSPGMVSNNSAAVSGVGSQIVIGNNTLTQMGGGGMNLYGIYGSTITGNTVFVPTVAYGKPITLGNLVGQHATNNIVSKNTLIWFPTSGQPAVLEDGATYAQFSAGDFNMVGGNNLVPPVGSGGNLYEFQKLSGNPDYSGTGSLSLSSVTPGADTVTAIIMQTEGPTANPTLAAYANNGAGTALSRLNAGGLQIGPVHEANLPAVGSFRNFLILCDDCIAGTHTPTGGGNGTLCYAPSIGSTWYCF